MPAATTIEITLRDFEFVPNDITIPANTDVVLVITNAGPTVHNLVAVDYNDPATPLAHSGNVKSGESVTMTVNLPPGDWFLYCDIMGHYDLDMVGWIHAT
jgi:uncharacterized cupredoxin-like copper-binding protein